jgi:Phospholipase_D-nuclease N-terminal
MQKIICLLVVKITTMQFFFLIALLFLAAAIITVIKLWQRTDVEDNTKLLWTILIVVAPFVGMLCYYLFGRRQSSL